MSRRRRWVSWAVVVFGIALPIATLVYGWAYASIRENRLKDRWIEELEARHDPRADYERTYAKWHRRFEIGGLAGLTLLLVVTSSVTFVALERQRDLADRKTAFVAAVTHELRTPLTTLRMHAEMLEQGLVPPERAARVHAELARETERLSRIVENVLAMSKLENGRWALDKRPADFAAEVKRVVAALEPRARDLGFALRVEAEDAEPIAFDPRALELVTQNLVENAMKFAAGCEPHEVELRVAAREDGVELCVSDHGPGIERAVRERVFERFDRGGRDDKPGAGLGLALVRELARAHGGDARVVDRERGASVAVWFPR